MADSGSRGDVVLAGPKSILPFETIFAKEAKLEHLPLGKTPRL